METSDWFFCRFLLKALEKTEINSSDLFWPMLTGTPEIKIGREHSFDAMVRVVLLKPVFLVLDDLFMTHLMWNSSPNSSTKLQARKFTEPLNFTFGRKNTSGLENSKNVKVKHKLSYWIYSKVIWTMDINWVMQSNIQFCPLGWQREGAPYDWITNQKRCKPINDFCHAFVCQRVLWFLWYLC